MHIIFEDGINPQELKMANGEFASISPSPFSICHSQEW